MISELILSQDTTEAVFLHEFEKELMSLFNSFGVGIFFGENQTTVVGSGKLCKVVQKKWATILEYRLISPFHRS
jgi:hypothetical protein